MAAGIRVTAPNAEVRIESYKLELLTNIGRGIKLLHGKKFVSLPIPGFSLALPRARLLGLLTSNI